MSGHTESPVKNREIVRVCGGCLATDCRLFDIREKRLERAFEDLTGLLVADGLLCGVCLQLLRKFSVFRTRCVKTFHILQQLNPLNQDVLCEIDRTHLKHNLARSTIIFVTCGSPEEDQEKSKPRGCSNTVTLSSYPITEHYFLVKHDSNNDDDENDMKNQIEVIKIENVDLHDFKNQIVTDATMIPNELIDNNELIENVKEESRDFKNNDFESCSDTSYCEENSLEIEKDTTNIDKEKETREKSAKVITKQISKLFVIIRKKIIDEDGDFHNLFEELYNLSLMKEETILPLKQVKRKKMSMRESLICLISLYKQLSELHNISIEFVSVSNERRAMDARRGAAGALQCRLCCRVYRSPGTLHRHETSSHQDGLQFRCEVCLYTFKKQTEYVLHLLKMHAMKKSCKECGKQIFAYSLKDQWEEVFKHIESFHRNALFPCEFCGQQFTAAKLRYMHVRSRHSTQMAAAQCLLCGDWFNGRAGVRGHTVKMHKAAAQCSACGVWFVDEPTRATHEGCPEHSGCPLCGATFPTEQLMKEHYDDIHAKYKCSKCIQTFIELKSYRRHHNQVCGGGRTLPRAARGAGGGGGGGGGGRRVKNSHICDVCGKGFDCGANLRYHQRMHTGEKPYRCEQCGKTFRIGLSLRAHMATHTGERRYKCGLCPKAFRQPAHLRTHMVTHTNEKRFGCALCDKRYTARPSLREHVRTVHEGLPPAPRNRHKNNA